VVRQEKFRSATLQPIAHCQPHQQSHRPSNQLASRLAASQLGIAGGMMVLDSPATWSPTNSPTTISTQPPTKHPTLTPTSSPTTKPSSTPTGTSGSRPCRLRSVSLSQLRLGLRSPSALNKCIQECLDLMNMLVLGAANKEQSNNSKIPHNV
jgi:hypothetical protein